MAAIRDFNTLTSMVGRGAAMGEVNEKLADVIETLANLSAEQPKKKVKGSVSLTVEIAVQNGIATISVASAAKKPKEDPRETVLWLTSDGQLVNEHPSQIDMFKGPRGVDGEALRQAIGAEAV